LASFKKKFSRSEKGLSESDKRLNDSYIPRNHVEQEHEFSFQEHSVEPVEPSMRIPG
jgi:hypothetical protein